MCMIVFRSATAFASIVIAARKLCALLACRRHFFSTSTMHRFELSVAGKAEHNIPRIVFQGLEPALQGIGLGPFDVERAQVVNYDVLFDARLI